jgi:anti-anti-sigma factor
VTSGISDISGISGIVSLTVQPQAEQLACLGAPMDRLHFSRSNSAATLTVSGDLDPRCLVELDQAISSVAHDGVTSIEIDLDSATFTGTAVLGALVAARRRCRRGGVLLVVHCADPGMSRLFAITGLDGSRRRPDEGVQRQLRPTA